MPFLVSGVIVEVVFYTSKIYKKYMRKIIQLKYGELFCGPGGMGLGKSS